MKQVQVCIVGGGCVGLALALALAKNDISVLVLDKQPAPQNPCDTSDFGLRVSAINHASEQLFEQLGVWQQLNHSRITPYRTMQVKDKDSFAKIEFSSEQINAPHLGHIIENELIRYQLFSALQQQNNATLVFNSGYSSIHQTEQQVLITLDDNTPVISELLVAADGANSPIRQQFALPMSFYDYGHHALVASVKTTEPHNHTARQLFLPDGPLAFLPMPEAHTHSIVWSCTPAQAKHYQQLPEDEFNKALYAAFDGQCGLTTVQSSRAVFPLTMRYARQWVKERVVLVGDAAHTIHPLAGLGMNLGLQDVALLAKLLSANAKNNTFAEQRVLREYERTRKLDAQKHIAMMQGLKSTFAGDNPAKKLLRGVGLSLVNNTNPLKNLFVKQALG